MNDLIYEKESYAIRGAIFEVYKEKGSGFLEDIYQECLEIEFTQQNISFVAQAGLEIAYKGVILKKKYKPDFICFDEVIIEIKAVKQLEDIHRAQLINYLKATDKRLGFLVNFHSYPKVTIERIVS